MVFQLNKSASQDLETLLLEDVPPDTRDSNGNSLLILAAQQVRSALPLCEALSTVWQVVYKVKA